MRGHVDMDPEGARLAAANPAFAALASERASALFGLHIVAHAVQDEAYNRTRFAVICLPQTMATPPASAEGARRKSSGDRRARRMAALSSMVSTSRRSGSPER